METSYNSCKIYLNGNLITTGTANASLFNGTTNAAFGSSINVFGGAAIKTLNGSLDEWRYSNIARTATEIFDYYNGAPATNSNFFSLF